MLTERLNELKEKVISMTNIVKGMVAESVNVLVKKDIEIAKKIVDEYEPQVNQMEIEIDNLCIHILALYQPEAINLRTVTMIMKMNNDLERIGDHAVNIVNDAKCLFNDPRIDLSDEIVELSKHAIEMLKNSIESFITGNAELAIQVCAKDKDVDTLRNQIIKNVIRTCSVPDVKTDQSLLDTMLYWILIAKNFERVADLATNIAENVVYITDGKTIKHHFMEKEKM